jgi:hypothetical protein
LVTGRKEEHILVHEFIDNATEENLNGLLLPNTVEYVMESTYPVGHAVYV